MARDGTLPAVGKGSTRKPPQDTAKRVVEGDPGVEVPADPPGRDPPLGLLLGRSGVLALLLDGAGRIVFANRAVAGREPGQLVGLPVEELAPAASREVLRAAVAHAFHPGLPQTLEVPVGADGVPTKHFLLDIAPTSVGGREHALVLGQDVTERRLEEERLRRAEQLMVDTEGITHLGTWSWDVTQPHAQWSAELYRIYGLDPAKHVPSYQDYLTRIHPDDVERVKRATEAVFNQHQPYSHDERIRRPDGSWRWLHTWAYPILDRAGQLVALAGVCQDVTEARGLEHALQASEARLRALFDHTDLGLAVLDLSGRVLEANQALARSAGLDGKALAGRPLADLLRPEDRSALVASLQALDEGRAPARRVEGRLAAAQGMGVPVRVDLARIETAQGTFAFAIVQDATLAAQATEADRVAFARLLEIRKLEETSAQRAQLLRIAGHEIKNPLTPVLVQMHLLLRGALGPLNERQAHAVAVAEKQAKRIATLVRDVLDVARIDQGRLTVSAQPTAVQAVTARVLEAYRSVAAGWQVHLAADVPADLPPVLADPERLEQVLVNLVSNGLKFTPAGGHVDVVASPAGRDRVEIRVRDTGPGMSPEQVSRIFQPFGQVHSPGQAREEGTGLGLYICRNLLQAMQGTIGVETAPGQGSTFVVRLPVA
jgi:PAS domain S-box-containing protein